MKIFYLSILSILFFASCSAPVKKGQANTYVVETVNTFNGEKHSRTVVSEKELTALEALQHVATIETKVEGKYVFVSAVDTLKNICCQKAWYYKVNGESPKVLAIKNTLFSGDTVTWLYKEDVCSAKKAGCKSVACKD